MICIVVSVLLLCLAAVLLFYRCVMPELFDDDYQGPRL